MESGYWNSQQKETWDLLPFQRGLPESGGLSTSAGEQFSDAVAADLSTVQPQLLSGGIQLLSDIKYVMKKMAMIVVGITLFVAGYRHIHKQTEYITAQAALATPSTETSPTAVPDAIKQTVAFRLVQPN